MFTDTLATLGNIPARGNKRDKLAQTGAEGGAVNDFEEVKVFGLFGESGAMTLSVYRGVKSSSYHLLDISLDVGRVKSWSRHGG